MTQIELKTANENDGGASSTAGSARSGHSVAYLASVLAGGNLFAAVLRMLGGVLQAKCVLPAVLGMYNSIGLVLGYVPFLQLGILNGVSRELPYYIGKGDRQRVNELGAAAQAWALTVGGAVGTALAIVACWRLVHGEWQLAAGWFTNAVLAVLLFYNTNYLQMTYRTSHDFARLAISSVIESAVALALVSLVAIFSFYGLCFRALLTALVSASVLHYWRPLRVAPRWNWRHLKHLLVIGAPIFIVGQVYAWWTVLNSTLVLGYMGKQGLGLYAMVIVAGGTLELLPAAVSQVLYPRMAEHYGRTSRLKDLICMSIKPTILSVACMVPLVVVAWVAVEPAVRLVLRNYVDAVPAIRWSLLVPVAQCLCPVNNVYNVLRRQMFYLTAIVFGMAVYFGSLMWLIRGGLSLSVFPQAMLVGRLAFALAAYALLIPVYWLHAKSR